MKALVTGGAGFIGSHIAQTLLAQGHDVRILDNMSSGRRENLDACAGADFVRGDITVTQDYERACKDRDTIFHHAALVSVQESIADPEKSFAINVQGTLNLLSAAKQNGVRRFVFASSAAVYGNDPRLPKNEGMQTTPISPYGADKAAAERHVLDAHKQWGLEGVVLRYFNVFGPRQDPNGDYAAVIPKFVSRLVAGLSPTVYGDGSQTRDFLYIDDAVAANLLAATRSEACGQVINIARGESMNLLQLLECLQQVTGHSVPPKFAPPRDGDIVRSAADISVMSQRLRFTPAVPLSEGLTRTAEYFRNQLTP
jgi:UDP-glucose 4-epimerase